MNTACYTRLFHLSDLHIRNTTRHHEYRQVFRRLVRYLRGQVDQQSLIVVTGDLMHTKTELSPESVSMAGDLLSALGELAPTLVIAGNHDCSLSNLHRMDAISAVLRTPIPGVHYLRESGGYTFGNLHFGVTSIYDHQIYPADSLPEGTRIALYHGPVHGARTDVGHRMNRTQWVVEDWVGYDYVLLGDVHRQQHLAPGIAYAGSLIQQDHGESLDGHGLLVWDLETGTTEPVTIPNRYGYLTLELGPDGYTPPDQWPARTRLRLYTDEMPESQYTAHLDEIGTHTQIVELSRIQSESQPERRSSTSTVSDPADDWEAHRQALVEYLEGTGTPTERVEALTDLHQTLYRELSAGHDGPGSRPSWSLETLRWSHMLCYGEDNVLHADQLEPGIIGIVAPNQWGKSAILDVLVFCLWDQFGRSDKRHIMNWGATRMSCSCVLRMGSAVYRIARQGVRSGKSVRVTATFHRVHRDGEEEVLEDLSGVDRMDTNRQIVALLGESSDYLSTVLSPQDQSKHDITQMTQSARKEYLHRVFRLDYLTAYHAEAKTRAKDLTTRATVAAGLAEHCSVADAAQAVEAQRQRVAECTELVSRLTAARRWRLDLPLAPMPMVYPELASQGVTDDTTAAQLEEELSARLVGGDVEGLEERLTEARERVADLSAQLSSLTVSRRPTAAPVHSREEATQRLASLTPVPEAGPPLPAVEIDSDWWEMWSLARRQWAAGTVDHLDVRREERERFSEWLSTLPPSEAITQWLEDYQRWRAATEDLVPAPEVPEITRAIRDQVRNTAGPSLQRLAEIRASRYQHYQALRGQLENDLAIWSALDACREREETSRALAEARRQLTALEESDLSLVRQHLRLVRRYRRALQLWQIQEAGVSRLRQAWEGHERAHCRAVRALEIAEMGLARGEEIWTRALELHAEADRTAAEASLWNEYVKVTHYTGLPLTRLERGLPLLENAVNHALSQLVPYRIAIHLVPGGKTGGSLNLEIVPEHGLPYPADLGCGLERFTISLAFRVALRQLPGVPRPDFLIIDEGWSCLDRDKLAEIGPLLVWLASRFRLVYVISHLDALQQEMNTRLEITREDGVSQLISHPSC